MLKRLAAATGQDVSSYVLARALPSTSRRFEELLALLGEGDDHRYVFAELNDLLSALAPAELAEAVAHAELADLSPILASRGAHREVPENPTLLHSSAVSNILPLAMTAHTLRISRMERSGSPSMTIRSARLLTSTVPIS
jgi:hypothetical protein